MKKNHVDEISYTYPVGYYHGEFSEKYDVDYRDGTIIPIRLDAEPYEVTVEAEGWSFHLLFGSQINGKFLCIPNWRVGCELSSLNDVLWNKNSLLGKDDSFNYYSATAVVYALKTLEPYVK